MIQEDISRSLGTHTVQCEALAMQPALEALDASVTPGQVSFVETHGTGTPIGDTIEIAAVAKAYHWKYREQHLVLGSVKTNIGHTESCSGITGIIKAILSLHHQIIPKHLNLNSINPALKLDLIPAVIPMQAIPWTRVPNRPRICSVSSFGITGTDAHFIIEESPCAWLSKP